MLCGVRGRTGFTPISREEHPSDSKLSSLIWAQLHSGWDDGDV